MNRYSVSLVLLSDTLDPEHIQEQLGMPADETRLAEHQLKHYLRYDSPEPQLFSADQQLVALVDRLAPAHSKLVGLGTQVDIRIWVGLFLDTPQHEEVGDYLHIKGLGMNLSPQMLQTLSEWNAQLCFDVYTF